MNDVKEINESLLQLEADLKELRNASQQLDESKEASNNLIQDMRKYVGHLLKSTKDTTILMVENGQKLYNASTNLAKIVQLLSDDLKKMDFPHNMSRLEQKNDSISQSVQKLQDNIISSISSSSNTQQAALQRISQNFEEKHRAIEKNQRLNLVSLILTIINFLLLVFVFLDMFVLH